MKKYFLSLGLLFSGFFLVAQDQPKLIVGIVVDQMRADYLTRYWDKLGEDGFKRLVAEGFNCKNAHFDYVPTYTGPGHASVYTGTTPMVHGIIANNWYDRDLGKEVYCVHDDSARAVGTDTDRGKVSPHRLIVPTLGDAVGVHTLFRGKVIGMSIKDRGAVLPVGHSADAAYWFDYSTGDFISSDYYLDDLPGWVANYNQKHQADRYVKEGWKPLLPLDQYTESTEDDTPYERSLTGSGKPVFPYALEEAVAAGGYQVLATTPHGNTLLREFAEAAIRGEQLGKDSHMDLLAISFSSPDMIGHTYGPQSIEVEDTYLRLDREIATLLQALDEEVGTGNYLLFLTADHAAAQVPKFLTDHRMKADYLDNRKLEKAMNTFLKNEFNAEGLIASYSNQQVFLDRSVLANLGRRPQVVINRLRAFLLSQPGVANVLLREELRDPPFYDRFATLAVKGWHPQRSGDLLVQYLPGWMSYPVGGTTHGSSYNYDTHVPLLFFGMGISHGETFEYVSITQIVATLCLASGVALPDSAIPEPVGAVFER